LDQSTDVLDFGEIPVYTEASQDVVITNSGSTTFEVLSTTLVEGASSAWHLERSSDTDLDPGETFIATVTFTPIELGAFSGRVQIRTTFDDEPNLYITLTGVGGLSIRDDDDDGFSNADGDCDDDNGAAYPGATEVCDGFDTDCDGDLPEGEQDNDYDGWLVCEGDCDDSDENVYPGADEICDDKDSDCDGYIPDRDDADEDGFSLCDGDCDDSEPLVQPSLVEVCDQLDNDCNGAVDDIDVDGDGHSPCLGGGDCDDEDRDAHPVIVDLDAESGGDGTVERPYDDIQTAIDNRDEICRTVVLAAGSYTVTTNWDDGFLRIVGGGDNASEVVLTPESEGERVFDVTDSATLVLENLTLSGAHATGDGGAVRAVAADVELISVIVAENRSTGDGGAVAVSSGVLTLSQVQFLGNVAADDGGALSVVSGILIGNGSVYQDNQGVRGGAVVLEASAFEGEYLVFTGNDATDEGGALSVIGGSLDIERSLFTLNSSQLRGGAVAITDLLSSTSVLRNVVFQDNVAAGDGGAVAIGGTIASFIVANNTLSANAAGGEGAGLYVDAKDATGLYIWSNVLIWSDGASGLYASPGSHASVGWNTAYLTTSGIDFNLEADEDAGSNVVEDPGLVDVSNDGDPTNDDLNPTRNSAVVDEGPADGSGPPSYRVWHDLDETENDRGYTGGQGAEQ
jgi:hypothetical protein